MSFSNGLANEYDLKQKSEVKNEKRQRNVKHFGNRKNKRKVTRIGLEIENWLRVCCDFLLSQKFYTTLTSYLIKLVCVVGWPR